MCEIFAEDGILIFDADVLIWFFHGNTDAQQKVLAEAPFKISAITYMELVQGMKNKQEVSALKKFLNNRLVDNFVINKSTSLKSLK